MATIRVFGDSASDPLAGEGQFAVGGEGDEGFGVVIDERGEAVPD